MHHVSENYDYLIVSCLQPGPKANLAERKAAMSVGQQFIKDKGYSAKTQV